MDAVADETINTEEMAAEAEAAAAESDSAEEPAAPEEEKKLIPDDDMTMPEGFEMPDLSDLDAMMKEAGL